MPRRHSSLVVISSALVVCGYLCLGTPLARAQDQTPPCPEYTIEGTIGTSPPGESSEGRIASVFVHLSGEPVPNHQVIATFSDASGAALGEPSVLVTDAGGRAQIAVPDPAESVNFVAEASSAPGCTGGADGDPRVLLEIVPVGGSAPDVLGTTPPPESEEVLAKTGPVSDVVALASLLLLAFGAAVGTGRGRRRALAAASGSVKRRFPR